MLTRLRLRDFRCFESLDLLPGVDWTIFVGQNAQGKTSILEAVCVALRLQSPRSSRLAPLIRHGCRGFVVDAETSLHRFQFYYSSTRKKLALDGVELKEAAEYLAGGSLVYFSNQDVQLLRGAADERRRFLDFLCSQIHPEYRGFLKRYQSALRSRNAALKNGTWSAVALRGFEKEWISSGERVREIRKDLLAALGKDAGVAHREIAGVPEQLGLQAIWTPEGPLDLALEEARETDARLRQTTVGPHRDDWDACIDGRPARLFGSEGQQKTVVIALRLAQVSLIERLTGALPVLLLDDVFGELDPARRNAVLARLPSGCQKWVTTTELDWLSKPPTSLSLFRIYGGQVIQET